MFFFFLISLNGQKILVFEIFFNLNILLNKKKLKIDHNINKKKNHLSSSSILYIIFHLFISFICSWLYQKLLRTLSPLIFIYRCTFCFVVVYMKMDRHNFSFIYVDRNAPAREPIAPKGMRYDIRDIFSISFCLKA